MREITDYEYKVLAHGIVDVDYWLNRISGSQHEAEIDYQISLWKQDYEEKKDDPDYKNAFERNLELEESMAGPNTYARERFFLLFTKEEWRAIKRASKTDEQIEYALDRLYTVNTVNAESEETQNYLKYLVRLGLITREKAAAITDGTA